MTSRLREKSGEAVMLVIMGAMVVGGIVMWLSTGHFHMGGMHGGKHSKENAAPVQHDTHDGQEGSPSMKKPEGDGERNKGKQ